MTVAVGTTGQNESTMILEDDKIVIHYHNTRIITVDRRSKTVELDNGGWFTVSTTTHMNRSLRRLFEEVDWVPYFAVSNRGGRLQIVSSDPPAHVSPDETRLEVHIDYPRSDWGGTRSGTWAGNDNTATRKET